MELDVFSLFMSGILNALTPYNLFIMVIGLVFGIVGGMLPGIAVVTAIALFLPFTFTMPPATALIALGAVYSGATYGGADASILINTPGQPSSVMTALDGYPMTLKGEAEEALYAALLASALGGILGSVVLLCFFKPLASVALKFGSESFFWMAIFGLSTLAAMFPGKVLKTLLAGAIGLGISCVGMDFSGGEPRFTFGYYPLVQGFDIIVLMVALFSISQMLNVIEGNQEYIAKYDRRPGAFGRAWRALCQHKLVLTVTGLAGTFIGTLPGAGGTVASIIAYNEAKRWDKNPDRFGKGAIDGVMIPECANNACVGGALVPLLALGIPGSASAAVMIGGLLAQGMAPGPSMFAQNADIVYTFIASLFIANIVMVPVGYLVARVCTRILDVPKSVIIPSVITLSCIGAFSMRGTMLDVLVVLVAGGLAYIFVKTDLPPVGVALGVVLGPIIEENMITTISRAQASSLMDLFVWSPLSMLFIVLTLFSLALPVYMDWKQKRAAGAQPARRLALSNLWRLDSLVVAFLTLTCGFFVYSTAMQVENADSQLFPYAVFACGLVCGLLILAFNLFEPVTDRRITSEQAHCYRLILLTFCIALAGYFLVEVVGFYTAMFLTMSAMLLHSAFVERQEPFTLRQFLKLEAIALVVIGTQYLAFAKVISVFPPEGLLI